MGDAVALVIIAALLLAGGLVFARIRVLRVRQLAAARWAAIQRAEDDASITGEYVRRVNAAVSIEELNQLVRDREEGKLWGYSSSRSSSLSRA